MLKKRKRQERRLKKKCQECWEHRKLMKVPFCRHDPADLALWEEMSNRGTSGAAEEGQ